MQYINFANPLKRDVVTRYGAMAPAKSPTPPPNPMRKHRQINMGAALATLIMPTAWFIGTCWAFAFYIRLTRELSWRLLIAVGGGVATFACGWLVFQAKKIGISSSNPKEATWHRVLFWTMLSAWLLGMGLGEMIFQTYTRTYYEVTGLNAYAGVSPGKSSGSQMLDAGVVTFDSGTWLDRARAASFQEGDVYCVSPILPAPEPPYVKDASGKVKLASYDFWAVARTVVEIKRTWTSSAESTATHTRDLE